MTENYNYDAIYQLTQVTQQANTTESYTYDAVGGWPIQAIFLA